MSEQSIYSTRGLVVSDVDGVLTDGGLYYSNNGEVIKKFNARDGVAFKSLQLAGYLTAVLSSSNSSEIVNARARDLGVDFVHSGGGAKEEIIQNWIQELGITWAQVFYIGDDIQDVVAMINAGKSACPCDASSDAREVADVILKAAGGSGCFREWVDVHLLDITSGENA